MGPADLKLADVDPGDYDALVIPGGQINPDLLRVDRDAMTVLRGFLDSGKPVAAICHGPWLLVEADAVRGRDVTSYKSIRRDLENRSEEHTSELQSLMRISYAVFCLKKKKKNTTK